MNCMVIFISFILVSTFLDNYVKSASFLFIRYNLDVVNRKTKTNFLIKDTKCQLTLLYLRLEKPHEKCLPGRAGGVRKT